MVTLTFNQQFILVCVGLSIGTPIITFILKKAFGRGMVYKIWLRIFPAFLVVIIEIYWLVGKNIGADPFYFIASTLFVFAIVLGTLNNQRRWPKSSKRSMRSLFRQICWL